MNTALKTFAVIGLFFCLAILAINPYFTPNYVDNIFYYHLGISLYETGSYEILNQKIVDWPPIFPFYLAGYFLLFGPSVIVGKIATLIAALAALLLLPQLLDQDNRPYPLATTFLFSLLPTSLIIGTMMMSDWLYMALSFLYLYLLNHLRTHKSIAMGVIAGMILGAACLTRYIGLSLGVATVVFLFLNLKQNQWKFKTALPEVICCAVSACMLLGWVFAVYSWNSNPEITVYQSNFASKGFAIFEHFDFLEVGDIILQLLFQWENVLEQLGAPEFLVYILGAFGMIIIAWGAFKQLQTRRLSPTDVYTLVVLIMVTLYHYKYSRFLLCIAPFLISYTFSCFSIKRKSLKKILFTIWCCWLLLFDGHLILLGNRSNFGGLSPLVSKSPLEFYKGEWHEIATLAFKAKEFSLANNSTTLSLDPKIQHRWIYFYGLSEVPVKRSGQSTLRIEHKRKESLNPPKNQILTETNNYYLIKN